MMDVYMSCWSAPSFSDDLCKCAKRTAPCVEISLLYE